MSEIIALSGGMDSTTLLGERKQLVDVPIVAVAFRYGSKHNQLEIEAAKKVADYYNVQLHVVDIQQAFRFANNVLMLGSSDHIPEGHYNDPIMKKTIVPGRNLIFASILASMAQAQGFHEIYLAIHKGDHLIYPDCRPLWYQSAAQAIYSGSGNRVRLQAPYLEIPKSEILRHGLQQEKTVPYDLTRTCYTTDEIACGECGACVERLEAWKLNDGIDPLQYRKF